MIDDLFGGGLTNGVDTNEQKTNDDPFADVSFHSNEDKEEGSDLFAGITVGNDSSSGVSMAKSTGSDPFNMFGAGSELPLKEDNHDNDFDSLMAGLSIGSNGSSGNNKAAFAGDLGSIFSESQTATMTANSMFPMGPIPYNTAPGFMLNQAYPSQPFNYGAMGGFLSQQQLLAAMANLQQLQQLGGGLNSQTAGVSFGSETNTGYSSAIPDIFNANMPNQASSVMMNNPKKEDSKAFDFISDHLTAARDTKRVT